MKKELLDLIEKVKNRKMSSEERLRQMKSFAYGNMKLHNDNITREDIDEAFTE